MTRLATTALDGYNHGFRSGVLPEQAVPPA